METNVFDKNGYAIIPEGVNRDACARLIATLSALPRKRTHGGLRHMLDHPDVASLAAHPAIRNLAVSILGPGAFAYTATLFEKSSDANWFLGWHQDLHIPVAERRDAPGFSHWIEKDGVIHAQPPADVLANCLAIRVNLDAATTENGSLNILPGSHRQGILSRAQIVALIESTPPVACLTPAGGLVAMRPLLLHQSSRMTGEHFRRVLHFEFSARDLPGGLEWNRRI